MSPGDAAWYAKLSEPCPLPAGTRIRLVKMTDDPCPIEPGAEGTVTGGSGAQIWVEWDDGRGLALATDVDRWEVIA